MLVTRIRVFTVSGADVRFIRYFTQDFPEAQHVRLEENFRSTSHILQSANTIISLNRGRLGKTLFTSKLPGDPIEVVCFRNPDEEGAGIVAEIGLRQREGLQWRDMAILYPPRRRRRSAPYAPRQTKRPEPGCGKPCR